MTVDIEAAFERAVAAHAAMGITTPKVKGGYELRIYLRRIVKAALG